jgi:hypothetical protein
MSVKRSDKNRKRKEKKKRSELKVLSRPRKPRACGPCYACCKIYPVEGLPGYEGSKPEGETCKWVTEDEEVRCSVYKDRPPVCSVYSCVWLRDGQEKQRLFFADERPDISGLVFDLTTPEHLATKALGGRPVLIAREFREGAYDTVAARKIFDRFLALDKVIVTITGKGEYNYMARNPADAQAVALAYRKHKLFKVISEGVKSGEIPEDLVLDR